MKKIKRESGVLLPVSSLPSKYGIGCFSKEAYEFVDFLVDAKQRYWQILPLGPTSYGDSPYQSFSTFAGNPYFIDPMELVKQGIISEEDCDACDFGDNEQYVDYGKIYEYRFKLLKKAYNNSGIENKAEFQAFIKMNQHWLPDYALFMAIKDEKGGISWAEWEPELRLRNERVLEKYKKQLKNEIVFYEFLQYVFDIQWRKLKKYANDKGIKIVGDIPIYVAFDSSDVWKNPELFQLDENLMPTAVAGCPPDAFTAEGQLWGNPLYRWDYHEENGFSWWMMRLSQMFNLYDVVRIDHFRGFDEYYSIPFGMPNAVIGKWEKGPGYALFAAMKKKLGDKDVIAEDLGFLTPSVVKLVKKTGYPGMKVLQFAFYDNSDSDYLPYNYTENCVVYTGTHDNDTTAGWYNSLGRKDRAFMKKYLNLARCDAKKCTDAMLRAALGSVASLCIIPMQDYLFMDGSARINFPSTLGDNWKWRLLKGQCDRSTAEYMAQLSVLYGRNTK